jgi:hypothetical protein
MPGFRAWARAWPAPALKPTPHPRRYVGLRDACDKDELRIAEVQNELAKLQAREGGGSGCWGGSGGSCPDSKGPAFRRVAGASRAALLAHHHAAPDKACVQRPVTPRSLSSHRSLHGAHRTQVDMLNTEAHNGRLSEALALLDAELGDKARPAAGAVAGVPVVAGCWCLFGRTRPNASAERTAHGSFGEGGRLLKPVGDERERGCCSHWAGGCSGVSDTRPPPTAWSRRRRPWRGLSWT